MQCQYCQALNDAEEHRCARCGRRLRSGPARSAPESYISTATAPALAGLYEALSRDAVPQTLVSEHEPVVQRTAHQRGLFAEMSRVVEMPSPVHTEQARPERFGARPRNRRMIPGQQDLSFVSSPNIEASSEVVIYCEAPVALPSHRVMAVLLDLGVVLIGLVLFLATFRLAGGQIEISKHVLPLFAGITAVFSLFYHFLYCICGGDTPGMRWTQLRLVDFDGRTPDREQRMYRLVGSCLSLFAAGLGLIWALVDEESLTWHDHISKTFPSPYQRD